MLSDSNGNECCNMRVKSVDKGIIWRRVRNKWTACLISSFCCIYVTNIVQRMAFVYNFAAFLLRIVEFNEPSILNFILFKTWALESFQSFTPEDGLCCPHFSYVTFIDKTSCIFIYYYWVSGLYPSIWYSERNTFRKLNLFPSSGEKWGVPTLLRFLEWADFNHWTNLPLI
jgi:hypothetical protein